MAAQILPEDVVTAQAPKISVGSFQWSPVEDDPARLAMAVTTPSKPQLPPLGPLEAFQGKNFAGKGFNTIFRPRSNHAAGTPVAGTNDNVLELNLTQETLKFSDQLGSVPNRGFSQQPDLLLNGVSYVQTIEDITNPDSGLDDGPPVGIHFEPGVWMSVPASTNSPLEGPTLCRMASIPHGTTINAQGIRPDASKPTPGKPNIPKVDITPFPIGATNLIKFPSQQLAGKDDRIPLDLDKFNQKGTITQAILDDPNTVLRNDISHQDIVHFTTIEISTSQTNIVGGGTANIAFLGGSGATSQSGGSNENAFAASMTATFWIETVRWKLSVPPGHKEQTKIRPAGEFGPNFVLGPTQGRSAVTHVEATSTQIQYSQRVLLNFNGLSWPHVSVATLGETGEISVALPPL